MKNYFLFILPFFPSFFSQPTAAQSTSVELRGSVFAQEDQQAIDFAHVSIPSKGIGTLTNKEGAFRLKVEDYSEKDTLLISFLGYETLYQPLSSMKAGGEILPKTKCGRLADRCGVSCSAIAIDRNRN